MEQNIGFIGCGSMGSALARACAGRGRLYLANRTPEKAERLAAELGAIACDNQTVARQCRFIFLGVKPHLMAGMLKPLGEILAARENRFVLVSMAAALTTRDIQALAGGAYPVIRIMPNTPVLVGAGVIQVCAADCAETELGELCAMLSGAGLVDRIDESLMDAAAAVSGCGPAFLCLAMEAMADGGVACGLPREKALRYAAQTLAGTGLLALQTGEHPGPMKDRVTSPGGTTIQGVRALEQGGARSAYFEAVIAAYEKTKEMAR